MTAGWIRQKAHASISLVALAVIALTVSAARADDPPRAEPEPRPWLAKPPAAAPAPAAPVAEPSRLPWRASLLIVVSAALGGAAVWVRSRKGGLAKLTSSRELRVISTVRVGPKGHLVLAGIGDRAMLLGVTDGSVRRIAWLPAESIVPAVTDASLAEDATTARARENTAIDAPRSTGATVMQSPFDPATRTAVVPAHRGAFADILRRLAGNRVDAPPRESEDLSPAATLAELRRDSVQWSKGATGAGAVNTASTSPFAGGTSRTDLSESPELEQQAAGILKRRSRKRA